jgi:hypothetical protein
MLPFALLSLVAGCGGDGPTGLGGLVQGSVSAARGKRVGKRHRRLSIDLQWNHEACSRIVIAPVSQSTTTWELQIANYSGRPAVGTYQLSPLSASSANPTASFYYTSGGNIQMFNSSSGQLVITSSSPSAVHGTFTFTATDPSGGAGSVTAQGSFNAQCAPGMACQ